MGMLTFSSGGKSTSKKTTPRGSGSPFSQVINSSTTTITPQAPDNSNARPQRNHSRTFPSSSGAPEKTGVDSPPLTLSSMDNAGKPPTGRYTEKGCLLDQKPESMVAESLRMKGELEFTRLLRVDGRFEGELLTDKGSLVVGPKGEVIGDLKNMQEVYVEGIVRGNVFANDVKVKNNGMLFGDVQCHRLTLDPSATIKGVADTATLKERAILEANPPPPSASSSVAGAGAATSSNTASAESSTRDADAPSRNGSILGDENRAPAPNHSADGASMTAKRSPAVEDTALPPEAQPSPSS